MSKPFDATTRKLLELDPAGWLTCLGLPVTGPVRAVDSDVSTVTAEVDTILQVGDPADYLAHIELQSGHDLTLPGRLLHYNVLLNHRHGRPVRSVAVLLRKEVDSPRLTGLHHVRLPDGSSDLDFRYSIVRVWTLDVEQISSGGLGMLPLAPLAKVGRSDIGSVIGRMKLRLDREVPENQASLLWASTEILMGLKYSEEFIESLLQGVQGMEESVTYQAILRRGEAKGEARGLLEGEQRALIRIGRRRLGEPSPEVVKRIEDIEDESALMTLLDRLIDVSSWDDLLASP